MKLTNRFNEMNPNERIYIEESDTQRNWEG